MNVAIYCRLSDEDDDKLQENDDSASIQNQKSMLIKYASCNGWTIYDIYSDDDYTGSDRNRPEFNRLLKDAVARKFDIVLCKTQSRFTRELELVEKYIHGLFPKLGIRFISIVDNADTADKRNKKSRQINGLVNEWFLEDLSENMKAVLTSRRQKGLHIGSFAPYGYLKDPDQKGHLMIDPEAAAIVREIFTLFSEGQGKQAIVKILNERGVPNPTEYKRLHGMIRNKNAQSGTLWHYYTVSQILINEVYIGNMVQGKSGVVSFKTQEKKCKPQEEWIVVKGTHDPIIERELWDQVQTLIVQKATPPSNGTPILFSGKVRCIHCGCRMRSVKNGDKRGFKCETHAVSQNACIGASISLRKLERIVTAQLHILAEEYLDQKSLEEGIDVFSDLREMHANLEAQIATYQRKISECNTGQRGLYLDKIKGIITESEYLAYSADFNQDKKRFESLIGECRSQIDQTNKTISKNNSRRLLAEQYTGTRRLTKEMADILIDHILVGRRDPLTKDTPVEIYWNF